MTGAQMGFFDFLKKKEKPNNSANYAPTSNATLPFYTSFGDSIYNSDIVVQSIRCKANEFRKLEPRHIRDDGKTREGFMSFAPGLGDSKETSAFATVCF